jgi:hypothetical protein
MADKKYEQDDPMELVGTVIDDGGDRAMEEMGRTFVEELARMRWSREDIMTVFLDPFYRGPHTVFRSKGLAYVTELIDSVMGTGRVSP